MGWICSANLLVYELSSSVEQKQLPTIHVQVSALSRPPSAALWPIGSLCFAHSFSPQLPCIAFRPGPLLLTPRVEITCLWRIAICLEKSADVSGAWTGSKTLLSLWLERRRHQGQPNICLLNINFVPLLFQL